MRQSRAGLRFPGAPSPKRGACCVGLGTSQVFGVPSSCLIELLGALSCFCHLAEDACAAGTGNRRFWVAKAMLAPARPGAGWMRLGLGRVGMDLDGLRVGIWGEGASCVLLAGPFAFSWSGEQGVWERRSPALSSAQQRHKTNLKTSCMGSEAVGQGPASPAAGEGLLSLKPGGALAACPHFHLDPKCCKSQALGPGSQPGTRGKSPHPG